MKKNPKPPMISQVPHGWINVVPADDEYDRHVTRCKDLIINSAKINSSTNNPEFTEINIKKNIQHGRTALWLRDDKCVTIAFHSLDGPTKDDPLRSPKFCVDAGIDKSLEVSHPLSKEHHLYQSIRKAVIYFGKNNEASAALYIWYEKDDKIESCDLIYPIFECARKHDTIDCHNGILENYKDQPAVARWCNYLRTWKLKSCKGA